MKLTLEITKDRVLLNLDGTPRREAIWVGETGTGVRVAAVLPLLRALDETEMPALEAEMRAASMAVSRVACAADAQPARGRDDHIITEYDPKPIPTRAHDWTARRAGYDGGDPPDPYGSGPTEQAAINDLLEQEAMREDSRRARLSH